MNSRKRAIVFVDGNNWYHNVKSLVKKPRGIDFGKLSVLICDRFGLSLVEVRYYNSVPDIDLGEENYYKHMVFLAGLKRKGVVVNTRKLKVIRSGGKKLRVEKGVDVQIASDMIDYSLVKDFCDVCILISGDADFLPAMNVIKRKGCEVITTCVGKGYSRDLRSGDFRYVVLKRGDLDRCWGGR
ncbi:NYN domain-containing protein [Candidatus Pacearchaeota archaeon]|nr:NYN domain-containing protein [Candidatus Pacearchaeota archaeon]